MRVTAGMRTTAKRPLTYRISSSFWRVQASASRRMTATKKRMLPRTWARVFFSYGVRSSGVGLVSRVLL